MYNDLHNYIVYCIWTNSTSIGICNQRWICGIINKIIIIINLWAWLTYICDVYIRKNDIMDL